MLKVTLDTNPIIYAFDRDHPSPVEPEQVRTLRARRDLDLAVTALLHRDVERDRKAARRKALLRAIEDLPVIGERSFRFDLSGFDGPEVLSTDADAELADRIERALWPNAVRGESKRWRSRVTDVDHLVAHLKAGRDVFVTTDKKVLKRADLLLECFGLNVSLPSALLARLSPPGA